jgi:hypothetical protein
LGNVFDNAPAARAAIEKCPSAPQVSGWSTFHSRTGSTSSSAHTLERAFSDDKGPFATGTASKLRSYTGKFKAKAAHSYNVIRLTLGAIYRAKRRDAAETRTACSPRNAILGSLCWWRGSFGDSVSNGECRRCFRYGDCQRNGSNQSFVTSSRGFDYSQSYHRPWLPGCSGCQTEQCWKTEQCEERRGEPSRRFGTYRLASHRLEEGCRSSAVGAAFLVRL